MAVGDTYAKVVNPGPRTNALSTFLGLKRVFVDAQRQNQIDAIKEQRKQYAQSKQDAYSRETSFKQAGINQGSYTPTESDFSQNGWYGQSAQSPSDMATAGATTDQQSTMPGWGESTKNKKANLVNTTKLRQEFINRPEVKEYVTINTSVRSMDSLLNKAVSGDKENKAALDQALITMFNKLTDPQSVVRESEYARTPENLPLLNRMNGAIEKIKTGGAGLTNDDRKALVLGAKIIANERGKTYNETLKDYEDLSSGYDLDPKLILGGRKAHTDYSIGGSSGNTGNSENKTSSGIGYTIEP